VWSQTCWENSFLKLAIAAWQGGVEADVLGIFVLEAGSMMRRAWSFGLAQRFEPFIGFSVWYQKNCFCTFKAGSAPWTVDRQVAGFRFALTFCLSMG
jgi:hypothetical protein